MREIELSEAAGFAGWRAQALRKGAGHKYIRRVPKPGGGYRYYYRTSGVTRGVGADLVQGAKFKLTHEGQPGHFEVVRRSGDRVVLKHDESGASMVVSAEALGDLLKREHADVVNTAKERLQRRLDAARKHGTPKQVARLEAQARRHGFDVPDARRQAAVDRMQAEADAADKRREPMPPAAPLDEDRPRVSMKEGAMKRDGITPEYAEKHGLKRVSGVALRDLPDGAVVEIRSAGELAQIATKKGDSWEVKTVTGKRKRAPFTVDQERFINSTRPAVFSLYHRAATATPADPARDIPPSLRESIQMDGGLAVYRMNLADAMRDARKDTQKSIQFRGNGDMDAMISDGMSSRDDFVVGPSTTLDQLADRASRAYRRVGDFYPDAAAESVKEALRAWHKRSRGLIYNGPSQVSWTVEDVMRRAGIAKLLG